MPIRNKNAELETRRVGETKGGRMGRAMTSRVGRWMGEGGRVREACTRSEKEGKRKTPKNKKNQIQEWHGGKVPLVRTGGGGRGDVE